jgi:hypothetical protein
MSSYTTPPRRDFFVLRLILPDKEVALPLPEDWATLRVQLDDDPTLELTSGAFHLALNSICFRSGGWS